MKGKSVFIKRRFPRFSVEWPCLYSTNNGPDSDGTAVNLSRGGCAIRTTTSVRKDEHLSVLMFPGPNQAPIEVHPASVRWATNGQFGVEFMMLARRDGERLESYLSSMEGGAK